MLLKRQGLPEEGILLICTVTKIYHNSIFVEIDEYGNKSGMIHISEIAPGRIRNIRDYVQEGKKIVCKVLRVDQKRGHVDLSFRRVNDNQRRKKVDEIKQEQKVEKLITDVAKKLKQEPKALFDKLMKNIEEDYDLLHPFFIDYVTNEVKLEDYIKDSKILKELKEVVDQRIKPPKVTIKGEITLYSKDSDGLDIIKKILKNIEDLEDTSLVYEGAGKYKLSVTANNYKVAESMLKNILDKIEKNSKKLKAHFEFERIDKK